MSKKSLAVAGIHRRYVELITLKFCFSLWTRTCYTKLSNPQVQLSTYHQRVSNKEDWCVVPYEIPDALISVELHCKPSGITSSISRARFTPCENTQCSKWIHRQV